MVGDIPVDCKTSTVTYLFSRYDGLIFRGVYMNISVSTFFKKKVAFFTKENKSNTTEGKGSTHCVNYGRINSWYL